MCKITSQSMMEEFGASCLPGNCLDLQQLILKKNPVLRSINTAVFPQLSNLTVLWIEKSALQEVPVELFTLTKV